jgi:hypothetical protein
VDVIHRGSRKTPMGKKDKNDRKGPFLHPLFRKKTMRSKKGMDA